MHRTWLVALVVAGCYSPKYKDCQFQCSSSSTCPTGLECTAGVCRLEGVTGPCVNQNDDAGGDSAIDSPMPMWTAPVMVDLGPMAFSSPTLNADETEMYLEGTDGKIYRTTRTTQAWAVPLEVTDLTAPAAFRNESPTLSSDGLALYFGSNRDASMGFDIQRVTRNNPTVAFSLPVTSVVPLNTTMNESGGSVTSGNQILVFSSDRGSSTAIYESVFNSTVMQWRAPTLLGELDSGSTDAHPAITGNGLTLVFTSDRGLGGFDLFFTHRATAGSAFSAPEAIPELSTVLPDVDPWISADGNVMYFARGQMANRKIYRSTRL